MTNSEIWKDIPNYEGLYQASNLGRIKSLKRKTTKGGILKQHINKRNGYCYICLSKNNKKKNIRVHKLILNTFNPSDNSEMQINHIDGNKTNNNLNNLEWVTQSENMKHAYKMELEKVTWNKKVICLETKKVYESISQCANDLNLNISKISLVCKGKRNKTGGLHFKYYEE